LANYDTRRVLDYRFGQLSASVTALDTTLQSAAFATLASDLSAEKYIPIIIADDALGLYEVVWLTAHSASSQSVTVVRGREGSTARAWASGALWRVAPTIRDVLGTVSTRGALPTDAHVGHRAMIEDEDAVVTRTNDGWERSTSRPFGHVGRTAGFQTIGQSVNGAYVQFDTAQELLGGMTLDNATDALVVPLAGRYRITVHGYFTGTTVSTMCLVEATINSTATPPSFGSGGPAAGARCSGWKGTPSDFVINGAVIRRLAAGDKVRLWHATPDSTFGNDGYNGAWLEVEYVGA
jgi:hypothetical protein